MRSNKLGLATFDLGLKFGVQVLNNSDLWRIYTGISENGTRPPPGAPGKRSQVSRIRKASARTCRRALHKPPSVPMVSDSWLL
jgi:hypothetical protein